MLNSEVFENIWNKNRKILIVTKYWDSKTTLSIWDEAQKKYPDSIYGLWENRIETIREKALPRANTHFIWNIQSQKIPEIVNNCSVIHSLSSLKHAKKIENQASPIESFIQIKLDENKDIGISEDEISDFLEACRDFTYLKIIWISGMWAWEVLENEKREEFRKLIHIRDTYIPHWLISAGTSRDYEVALEEWIDVVRIGNKALI